MNELPKGWVTTTVADVAEVRLGRQRSPKTHTGHNMRPYLRAANVTWSGLDLSDVKQMHFSESEVDTYRLVSGDVLLAEASGSRGEVGKPALWNDEIPDCCFQNTLLRVRTRAPLPKYLLHFLQLEAMSGRLGDAARGVGIHHLGAGGLSSYRLPLAPRPEEERIVAAIEEQFSRLDAAEKLLRSARRRARGMRWCVLATVTPTDGQWKTLGEIAEIVGGVPKDSKRQSDPSFVEVPYLRVANVQRGYLDLREVTTIRVAPEKAEALRLEPGDILFNEGGDRDKLGRGWVWRGEIDDCIHQNHVFRARLLVQEADPKYISLHGNTFGQQWFERMGKQTTNLASINLKTLKSFPVPDLPAEEQRRIVAEVERNLTLLDSLALAIERSLTRVENLRRSILQRAFSGELVPRDPGDEPASEFLARIATGSKDSTRHRRRKRA